MIRRVIEIAIRIGFVEIDGWVYRTGMQRHDSGNAADRGRCADAMSDHRFGGADTDLPRAFSEKLLYRPSSQSLKNKMMSDNLKVCY